MKKAQSLSINVIIIAILAILVLVIIGVIFTGRAGLFSREINQGCVANGGVCLTAGEFASRGGSGVYTPRSDYECPTAERACYVLNSIASRG